MTAEIMTNFVIDLLTLTDVMMELGIARSFIRCCMRSLFILPLLDAA